MLLLFIVFDVGLVTLIVVYKKGNFVKFLFYIGNHQNPYISVFLRWFCGSSRTWKSNTLKNSIYFLKKIFSPWILFNNFYISFFSFFFFLKFKMFDLVLHKKVYINIYYRQICSSLFSRLLCCTVWWNANYKKFFKLVKKVF